MILVLSLALYPYVYLLARSAFLTQGRRALEAAQTLGPESRSCAWRVALPLARPWIAAGVALVCMETLADFGAVSVFNYNTFTTAIYRAWFGMFSVHAALELAAVLMVFVFAALVLERRRARGRTFRERAGCQRSSRRASQLARRLRAGRRPRSRRSVFAIAFVLPVLQLLWWVASAPRATWMRATGASSARSLLLAGSGAFVIVAASRRCWRMCCAVSTPGLCAASVRLATMGYAVPGTVLAVGILAPLVTLNNGVQGPAALVAW